ncbi:hypothetical protein DBW_1869 [Desulfuromonas sp. DDH964]|nr:hypothetical protein DBW_1869 [Desulfuromonas sp. DDH964]
MVLSPNETNHLNQLGIILSEKDAEMLDLGIQVFTCNNDADHDGLITAFCQYIENGVYPSNTVLDELHKRFRKYLYDNEKGKDGSDLGKYFGSDGRRMRWKNSVYDRIFFHGSLYSYCLNKWFNLDTDDAIGLVSNWVIDQESKLPVGWSSNKRPKSKDSLHKFYYTKGGKNMVERVLAFNGIAENPDKNRKLAILEPLEDYLTGYPNILLILKGLRS